jgi:hypothetical protein
MSCSFGGLLIHPDLFAQTNFRLFCLRYVLLSCTEIPPFAVYCSASVQQKNCRLSLTLTGRYQHLFPGCQPSSKFAPNSINTSAFVVTNPTDEPITSGLPVIQQEYAAGGDVQIMAYQKSLVPHVGTADDLFRASGRAPHPEARRIPCRAS